MRDLVPGSDSSAPECLAEVGGRLLFAANHRNAAVGTVLWATDGSPGWDATGELGAPVEGGLYRSSTRTGRTPTSGLVACSEVYHRCADAANAAR